MNTIALFIGGAVIFLIAIISRTPKSRYLKKLGTNFTSAGLYVGEGVPKNRFTKHEFDVAFPNLQST